PRRSGRFRRFFFPAPAASLPSPLSLHDSLPIYWLRGEPRDGRAAEMLDAPDEVGRQARLQMLLLSTERLRPPRVVRRDRNPLAQDRKSTRLNSSHGSISYAVFCLTKKTHTVTEL